MRDDSAKQSPGLPTRQDECLFGFSRALSLNQRGPHCYNDIYITLDKNVQFAYRYYVKDGIEEASRIIAVSSDTQGHWEKAGKIKSYRTHG
ncbi:MAG: hypothetical protein ABR903_05065 [Thermodesulfovibrionales bacterium]